MSTIKYINKLAFYRKNKDLTQKELAEKVEVTHEYISILERGIQTPGLLLAKRIADELGSTVDEIFFTDKPNKTFENKSTA